MTSTRTLPALALLLTASAAALTGCGAASPGSATPHAAAAAPSVEAASATLEPGDPVPAPEGRTVLRVKGGTVHNVGSALALDLDQLESIGTVSYEVEDSQATGRRVTFSGPLVRDVLALAGADGTTMHTIALNDYSVDVPVSDAEDLPLMLATRMNGHRISVADYGPTRFVYPTEGYDLKKSEYDPRWIWQLKTIVVQ